MMHAISRQLLKTVYWPSTARLCVRDSKRRRNLR